MKDERGGFSVSPGRSRGFTLLEAVFVLAFLSILFATSYALYINVAHAGAMEIGLHTGETLVRRAEYLASASENDARWGVHFASPSSTIFKGDSYATRDQNYDENIDMTDFGFTGQTEYVFERRTGLPLTSGTLTFTDAYTGEVRQFIVNEKGTITIQ